LKQKQERASHIQFKGAAYERSLAPLSKVVSQKLWHHHHDSTTSTNAFHERKLCGQPAFEGLDAHMCSYCWHKTHRECRTTSKQLQANGMKVCELLNIWPCYWWKTWLPNAATCTVRVPVLLLFQELVTGSLLLAKSPGAEEKCQSFEGYYRDISLTIAKPLTITRLCLIMVSSIVLYTQCAFSEPIAYSRSSTKKSSHWKSQAFFRKLTLLLIGLTTHAAKHWH